MRTQVREVFHKGPLSVVEWKDESGEIQRSIFPTTELIEENGTLFVENVDEGQPYGVDWESYILLPNGAKAIATILRRRGIWTLEDYAKNSAAINSAFNEANSLNLQDFRHSVLRQGKDE